MKKSVFLMAFVVMCAGLQVRVAYGDHPRSGWNHRNYEGGRNHYSRHHYRPGYRVNRLPSRHHHFVHRNRDYYYFGGSYFNRHQSGFEVVLPPLGARVPYLPPGYVVFNLGPRRYYYANYVYYLWDEHDRDYIVVREPEGGDDLVVNNAPASFSEIYAYPSQGQSPEQQERDYYDCHVWSVDESDYDPTLEGQNAYRARDYRRAMIACLEGRGYSVR